MNLQNNLNNIIINIFLFKNIQIIDKLWIESIEISIDWLFDIYIYENYI